MSEMSAMNEAYEKYKDSIQIIAASNYAPFDSDQVIINYHNQHPDYNIPMMVDRNGLSAKFELRGWPTTIIIDRYGAIARIEVGAVVEAEAWGRMIEKYIGDDYVQTFVMGDKTSESINSEMAKPDIKIDGDHYEKLAEVLHDTSTFPAGTSVEWRGVGKDEQGYEYAWPFIYDVVDGVSEGGEKVVYSSNTGKANSYSVIYAAVKVESGKVLTFDYWAQTEDDDVFSVVWDGKVIKQIYGDSNGWKTCYLYTDIVGGTHTVGMTYMKDGSNNTGKDNVYLRNLRFVDISDIDEPTDMLRAAAYGIPAQNATEFPYYAEVLLESDGYYHVKKSALENAQYAGNDDSPMLFVNMLGVTNWSNKYSLNDYINARDENDTEKYKYNCTFNINGVAKDYRQLLIRHLNAATASDIYGFMPVDKELHDILVKFMATVSGNSTQPNEWLKVCYFYSHYGDNNFIGNPVIGLLEKTAIPVVVDTETTADITRKTPPFPAVIYTFTAPSDGVYKIQSKIPDYSQQIAQIWLYDDNTSAEIPLVYDGDLRFIRDGNNEQNFTVYRYMKTGEKYYLELAFLMNESGKYKFEITNVGESATALLPCSDNIFTYNVDEDGKPIGDLYLAGAIEYELGADGYYHVKNAGGTDDFIYLDVKYATSLTYYSISQLLTQYSRDPANGKNLDYKVFDFRYIIEYFSETDSNGETINTYDPKVDLRLQFSLSPAQMAKIKDYTQFLTDYIANPANKGPEDGLVKVNQDIVDLLSLFIELRINGVMDGVIEAAYDNEWLRFCWYYRTYDETHP